MNQRFRLRSSRQMNYWFRYCHLIRKRCLKMINSWKFLFTIFFIFFFIDFGKFKWRQPKKSLQKIFSGDNRKLLVMLFGITISVHHFHIFSLSSSRFHINLIYFQKIFDLIKKKTWKNHDNNFAEKIMNFLIKIIINFSTSKDSQFTERKLRGKFY